MSNYYLAHLCNIAINFKIFLNNYHYIHSIKLYIIITILMFLVLSISILFMSLLQLINGGQFLNITPAFLSSACLAAASSPMPVIAILPLISMYASL